MKKIFPVIAAFLMLTAVVFLNGCCHAQVTTAPAGAPLKDQVIDNMSPVAIGQASSSGYYLFNTFPLYTGNPEKYNRKDYHSLRDDLNFNTTTTILLKEMRRKYGAEGLIEVVNTESSWGWFSLWIVWRRVVTTQAIGVKTVTPERK